MNVLTELRDEARDHACIRNAYFEQVKLHECKLCVAWVEDEILKTLNDVIHACFCIIVQVIFLTCLLSDEV